MKLVLLADDGRPMAEIDEVERYDLSNTRGRAMLIDDILVAMGQADRRRVLDFIREQPAASASPEGRRSTSPGT